MLIIGFTSCTGFYEKMSPSVQEWRNFEHSGPIVTCI